MAALARWARRSRESPCLPENRHQITLPVLAWDRKHLLSVPTPGPMGAEWFERQTQALKDEDSSSSS